MKFVPESKFQFLLIIALITLISQVATSRMTQLPDFGSDEEIESILNGKDPLYNNHRSENNMFEDLNFLEHTNLYKNSTNAKVPGAGGASQKNSIVDLSSYTGDFSGWFAVSNVHFNDPQYFPVGTESIKKHVDFTNLDGNNFLINQAYVEGANKDAKNELMFFFRYKNGYIYFANKKDTMAIVDSIKVNGVSNSEIINTKVYAGDSCLDVIDSRLWRWTLCASSIAEKKKWLCSLEKSLKQKLDPICGIVDMNAPVLKADNSTDVYGNATNPIKKMFIIPKESPNCNANWNYKNQGSDWECICAEGITQSPINLPRPNRRMITKMKPLFLYDVIQPISKDNSIDGVMRENEPIKIFNRDGQLKIMHSNLGKIVQPDGSVYHGEEIIFHTPAEHTINGKKFDMEIQVVHYGVSKGDIAKQVTVSFLFYVKPGVFNEFLDKIDVYNLPNEIDQFKDLTAALNVPTIFYSNAHQDSFFENEQIPMKDFSFYQYPGSLTSPPCTERTTVIVAAEPLPISNTFVELFREALRKPEYFGIDGKLYNAEDAPKLNNRNVQPLNGRKIEYYQSQVPSA